MGILSFFLSSKKWRVKNYENFFSFYDFSISRDTRTRLNKYSSFFWFYVSSENFTFDEIEAKKTIKVEGSSGLNVKFFIRSIFSQIFSQSKDDPYFYLSVQI